MSLCTACYGTKTQMGGGYVAEPCSKCQSEELAQIRRVIIEDGKFNPKPMDIKVTMASPVFELPVEKKKNWFKRFVNIFIPHRNEIGWLRGSIKWLFRL